MQGDLSLTNLGVSHGERESYSLPYFLLGLMKLYVLFTKYKVYQIHLMISSQVGWHERLNGLDQKREEPGGQDPGEDFKREEEPRWLLINDK